jgi:hypothetical protein
MIVGYFGYRKDNGDAVVRRKRAGRSPRLPWRLDLSNHSPTGLEWGYGGSGPAQLSLAILADALDDDARALKLHQKFKWKVIGRLSQAAPWQLSLAQVQAEVAMIEQQNEQEVFGI